MVGKCSILLSAFFSVWAKGGDGEEGGKGGDGEEVRLYNNILFV